MELRHLRHVLALAEHGSFARAAQALHLSQPALSRSIQSLEAQVGTALFLRSNDGVSPTDIGRLLIQRARAVVQLADELDQDLSERSDLRSGKVAAGAGPFPAESLLTPAVAKFALAHPRVGVRLRSGDWDTLLRELRNRELDFFVADISTLAHEAGLRIEPMNEHPMHFVARAGHPLTACRSLNLASLFDWPFVAASRIPPRVLEPMLDARRRNNNLPESDRVFPSIECSSPSMVKRIVCDSDAVTALPLTAIDKDLAEGRLALLGTRPWLKLRYGIVSLRNASLTRAATGLYEFVAQAEQTVVDEESRLMAKWSQVVDD